MEFYIYNSISVHVLHNFIKVLTKTLVFILFSGGKFQYFSEHLQLNGRTSKFFNDLDVSKEGIIYFSVSSTKWFRHELSNIFLEGENTGMWVLNERKWSAKRRNWPIRSWWYLYANLHLNNSSKQVEFLKTFFFFMKCIWIQTYEYLNNVLF